MAKGAYIGVNIGLSSEYTLVEYIESTGTQFIDTGINPSLSLTSGAIYECEFIVTKQVTSDTYVYGSLVSGYRSGNFRVNAAGTIAWFIGGNGNVSYCATNVKDKGFENGATFTSQCKIDNVNKTYTISVKTDDGIDKNENGSFTGETSANGTIYLFYCRGVGSTAKYPCKMLRFTIRNLAGVPVCDLVPCYRKSDNVVGMYDLVNGVFHTNAGTGTFTAGANLASSVARKIKKSYVGVDGVARKIKKAYIGIGGVARPCWASGLEYYGRITDLTTAYVNQAATTVGNYALFGGGGSNGEDASNIVDAYNRELTHSVTPNRMSYGRYRHAATTVGDYAIFGGGGGGGTVEGIIATTDAYDSSLVHHSSPSLRTSSIDLAATTVGNYALFGGGFDLSQNNAYVTAFNDKLTRSYPQQNLSVARHDLSATSIGNYALFAGGSGDGYRDTVDVYNTSLTRSLATNLSVARGDLAGTSVGDYALFGGGGGDTSALKTVDAYNTSLTRVDVADLSYGSYNKFLATTVGKYALFCGGSKVESYSESLVKEATFSNIPYGVYSATSIGKYAIFAGVHVYAYVYYE